MKAGIELIAEERQRQIEVEGYTIEQDQQYKNGDLALAAVVYATPETKRVIPTGSARPSGWPWLSEYWKPSPEDRIRELQKAGALIAAEIDRLLRIENSES